MDSVVVVVAGTSAEPTGTRLLVAGDTMAVPSATDNDASCGDDVECWSCSDVDSEESPPSFSLVVTNGVDNGGVFTASDEVPTAANGVLADIDVGVDVGKSDDAVETAMGEVDCSSSALRRWRWMRPRRND